MNQFQSIRCLQSNIISVPKERPSISYNCINKMGGKESAITEQDLQIIESNHPQFRKIRLLHHQDCKSLQAEFTVANSGDLSGWAEEAGRLRRQASLFLPEQHSMQRKFVCGQGGVCKINYPYFPFLLSDYIARLDGQDHLYENEKVWYLLFQLCEAAHLFHSQGLKVGDVRPVNIFLDNAERVKIGNRFSWPHASTNYEKSLFDKEVTYLAPEELRELSFGHNEPTTDLELAESFSVGLTLLDRATLTNSSSLYNLPSCRLEYEKLEERLGHLWNIDHLDEMLKQIIEGLCKADSGQRLRCRVVYDWLKRYKEEIVGRNPPKFKDYPPFLTPRQPVPIPKNQYVQSQVVSEFPKRAEHLQPISLHNHRQIIESTYLPPLPPPLPLPLPQARTAVLPSDDFTQTLRKIEQQLQRSRKMFPS